VPETTRTGQLAVSVSQVVNAASRFVVSVLLAVRTDTVEVLAIVVLDPTAVVGPLVLDSLGVPPLIVALLPQPPNARRTPKSVARFLIARLQCFGRAVLRRDRTGGHARCATSLIHFIDDTVAVPGRRDGSPGAIFRQARRRSLLTRSALAGRPAVDRLGAEVSSFRSVALPCSAPTDQPLRLLLARCVENLANRRGIPPKAPWAAATPSLVSPSAIAVSVRPALRSYAIRATTASDKVRGRPSRTPSARLAASTSRVLCALIMFFEGSNPSEKIEAARSTVLAHPNCTAETTLAADSSMRTDYILRHKDDPAREIHVALLPAVIGEPRPSGRK
jgi:hypothetical protein